VPPSVSSLWPIRRASINIGSIILSSEFGDGLHMRAMMLSTIPPTPLAMCGQSGDRRWNCTLRRCDHIDDIANILLDYDKKQPCCPEQHN
jgi:hypothetical protein